MKLNQKGEAVPGDPLEKLADEVTSIRNQLWNVVDDMAMTRHQYQQIETVKERMWRVQKELRELYEEKCGPLVMGFEMQNPEDLK